MKDNIGTKLSKFSSKITTKLLFVILFLVVPVNVLAVILNNYVIKSMRETIDQSTNSVIESYITFLDNRMAIANYLLRTMKYENESGVAMLIESDEEYYKLYRTRFYWEIQKLIDYTEGMDTYFYIVRDREDILIWNGEDAKAEKRHLQKEWEKGWHLNQIGEMEALCLWAEVKEVIYGGWIDLDQIRGQMEEDIQYESSYITFTEVPGEEDKGWICVTGRSKNTDFYVNVYLKESEITGKILAANAYLIAGTVITMAAFFFVLYLAVYRLLIDPLNVLNAALEKVEEGDLDYRIAKEASSAEYEYSFLQFNRMTEHIRTLKIESYEKELEKKRMELENLQLQIRPHFLLNIFQLLYALAKRHENGAIQDSILYLSEYFRHLFRSGRNLELFGREQKLIESYIDMARINFPDSIEIEYDYDPEIRFVRLPPLLLHNFVENIVKHVVKKGTVTHITIVGQYEERYVQFMIMDDGPGIPEEMLKELDISMRQEQADGSHVGFANSLKRLKYFYGDQADIILSSEEGEGTCITLLFPYDLEET